MYGHVITKFSRMGSLPHFVTHGAPLRALRARAPLITDATVTILALCLKLKFNNECKTKISFDV